MKLNTRHPLITFTGEAIHDAGGPVTFGTVAVAALLAAPAGDTPTHEEKLWRYNLARRLHAGGKVEISAEEGALILRMVGKGYPAAVLGAMQDAIEQGGQHVPH